MNVERPCPPPAEVPQETPLAINRHTVPRWCHEPRRATGFSAGESRRLSRTGATVVPMSLDELQRKAKATRSLPAPAVARAIRLGLAAELRR